MNQRFGVHRINAQITTSLLICFHSVIFCVSSDKIMAKIRNRSTIVLDDQTTYSHDTVAYLNN